MCSVKAAMSVVIKVENLSKQYRLGIIGTGSLAHDVNRWWHIMRGKEDPYLKIGEENDCIRQENEAYVWALKDLNFEVQHGEVLGIIGRNGAGKSTLLKILSRTTAPTKGHVKIKGRVASLLEVGTGFHPELTGRENIFLNGAILGMTKAEIKRKMDEIVDFSGVERYIDTPVKRYSSGMYVRLAFAVAAHLEPDILIVDEVLAVGDAAFQKKCLGKMKEVSVKDGRTVLFVSHNMAAIRNLCDKAVVLVKGRCQFEGNAGAAITAYLDQVSEQKEKEQLKQMIAQINQDENFELLGLDLNQGDGKSNFEFVTNKAIRVIMRYSVKKRTIGLRIGFDIVLKSVDEILFRTFHDDNQNTFNEFEVGVYQTEFVIPPSLLIKGVYQLKLSIGIHNVRWIVHQNLGLEFHLNHVEGINQIYADDRPGLIMPHILANTMKV